VHPRAAALDTALREVVRAVLRLSLRRRSGKKESGPSQKEEEEMSRRGHPLATVVLAVAVACGPSPEQIDELKAQQKEILGKLGAVDTTLEKIAAASPAPTPSAPAVDPNQVFELPVGASPVKGDPNGKVAIVEFADFQ
jgi:hypothetical protein